MQGYTNRALRALYVTLNPTVTTWTEMEKLSDLQNPSGWRRRFDDAKCVLQINWYGRRDTNTYRIAALVASTWKLF